MRYLFLYLLISAFIISGCSSGNNPTEPGNNTPVFPGNTFFTSQSSMTGIFGMYELGINPTSESAELVAKRTSSLGESYIVNGISYFTIAPCADCPEKSSRLL